MPFELPNSPRTSLRVMNDVLRGVACAVNLDDMNLSTSLQEHIVRLRQFLDKLKQADFKVRLDKTKFLKKEVAYVGRTAPDRIGPNPLKIFAIQNYLYRYQEKYFELRNSNKCEIYLRFTSVFET